LRGFFSPPHELLEEFDVVVSFGVVEHFENTVEAIQGISRMLKPKGKMVTIIPNLVGILGTLQKVLDVTVYDAHVPLDRQGLASAHAEAGLEVESCEYFLPVKLGNLDIENWAKKLPYKITVRLRSWISKLFWLVEDHFGFPRGNRFSSPYINCVGQKPCA
jgi:SAM-dependent methyltransferase